MRQQTQSLFLRFGTIVIPVMLITTLSSCNVLMYKYKPFFTESNLILTDTIFTLYQGAFYDRPHMQDEERTYQITFQFRDSAAAQRLQLLDLSTDSSVAKAKYGIHSIWNWTGENNKITGSIKILHWDKDKVVLKEHIQIDDIRRSEKKRFYGTRTFRRAKD